MFGITVEYINNSYSFDSIQELYLYLWLIRNELTEEDKKILSQREEPILLKNETNTWLIENKKLEMLQKELDAARAEEQLIEADVASMRKREKIKKKR